MIELDLKIKRPALRYHGSKFRLAPWIMSFMPEHSLYCEPYGGGAAVLLRKSRARVEVYNDLDSEIVNLFRLLRSPNDRRELAAQCALTPFSREEYRDCFEPCSNDIERARRMVARSFMGFASHSHEIKNSNGFRTRDYAAHKSYAREWVGVPENLLQVAKRFQGVTIENLPAIECMAKYDRADGQSLFYVDPPYVLDLRDDHSKGYRHEMGAQDHRELAWSLHQLKGKVIISGYSGRLYAELFSDWYREEKLTTGNGQIGSVPRTEVLWMNFTPASQPPQ